MKKTSLFALAALVGFAVPAVAEEEAAAEEKGREIVLQQDKTNPLAFAEKELTATAGETVTIVLDNSTSSIPQPHNVLFCKPESLQKVMAAAQAAITDPKYMTSGCVPESEDVLFAVKLVQPGQKGEVTFTVPEEAGDYPYVCTFPGHWMTMNGVLKVTAAE